MAPAASAGRWHIAVRGSECSARSAYWRFRFSHGVRGAVCLMRGPVGELEEADEFGGVVFCCHAVGILLPARSRRFDKRDDRRLDLACFRRFHLMAGSVVNGHGFVLRSDSPARFGSAAAGWGGGRGRMGGDGLSRSQASQSALRVCYVLARGTTVGLPEARMRAFSPEVRVRGRSRIRTARETGARRAR